MDARAGVESQPARKGRTPADRRKWEPSPCPQRRPRIAQPSRSAATPPPLAASRAGARRRRGAYDERRRADGRRQPHHGRGGRLPRARGAAVRAEHAEPHRPAARHAAAGLAAAGYPGRHAAHPDQPAGGGWGTHPQLKQVTVSGSATGVHPGRLAAYSQGDGASFVPAAPFQPGETVTVHGQLLAHGHWEPFAFHFTVSVPDPIPNQPPGKEPEGKSVEVQHYHSAPSLDAPSIEVDTGAGTSATGDIFSAPYSGPGGDGPMIIESDGQLVWFDPLPKGTYSTNLQVQSYEGQPVLTWWQGYIPPQGFGEGEEVIINSSYKQILHVHGGNGLTADLHDFHIEANDTALLTVFNPIRCNLTAVDGPQDGAVNDSIFQEIDLRTGLVRRQWDSVDHVALASSYSTPYGASDEWPFDFFHVNSLDPEPGGGMLISARNTWALYEMNEAHRPGAGGGGRQAQHDQDGLGHADRLPARRDAAARRPDLRVRQRRRADSASAVARDPRGAQPEDRHRDAGVRVRAPRHRTEGRQPGQRAAAARRQPLHRLGGRTVVLGIQLLRSAGVRRAHAHGRRVLPGLPLRMERHPRGAPAIAASASRAGR